MNELTMLLHLQQQLVLVLLVLLLQRRRRRMWVRPIFQKRNALGEQNLVEEMRKDRSCFFHYFRMYPETFDELLSLIGPSITKCTTNWRKPIPAKDRLAMTLRYLATGDSQQTISFSFRVGYSTVCKAIGETCDAISKCLMPTHLKFPTTQEWVSIAEGFEKNWNFPNCLGALDGKHIVIQAPARSGSEYFNYKGQHSIVLLALCDSNHCFTMIDVGDTGRHSDGGVFANCEFGQRLLNDDISFPVDRNLSGTTVTVPYCMVADAAFPLRFNLMRPYPGRVLPEDKRIFNYRLSRARRIIENTFGILAARWRIFRRPIFATPQKVILITKAACCLHNYMQKNNSTIYCPNGFVDGDSLGELRPGLWRLEAGNLQPLGRSGSNYYSRFASDVRNRYKDYFISPQGALPWQISMINRHEQ